MTVWYTNGGPCSDVSCALIARRAILDSDWIDALPGVKSVFAGLRSMPLRKGRRVLAFEGDFLVGFADHDPATGLLRQLYVDVPWRGLGIGSQLLARVAGPEETLVNVISVNGLAIHWYLARGFETRECHCNILWQGDRTDWLHMVRVEG